MKAWLAAVGLIAVLTGHLPSAWAHATHADHRILHLYGDLRLIAGNALTDTRSYADFDPGPDLWGIGLPAGLDAELLVLGGRPFSGAFEGDRPVMRSEVPDEIAFFAYAHVDDWMDLPVPAHVVDFNDLTAFIETIGLAYGFDPVGGFPFRLEASVDSVDWFVVRGLGDLEPDPLASFLAARKLGSLGSRRIEAFGTYASDLMGVASAPGTPVHLHFATSDNQALFVGHVDNAIRLKPGARLFLPRGGS